MVRKRDFSDYLGVIWAFVAWITGFIVSLAVGFGMIDGVLRIPYLSGVADNFIVVGAGWVVVVLSVLGVAIAIVDRVF